MLENKKMTVNICCQERTLCIAKMC